MANKTRNFSIFVPDSKGLKHEIRVLDFIENFLYIRPKPINLLEEISEGENENSSLIKFKLNPQQMRFYLQIEDDWKNYRPIRYAILKARQIGFSTLIAAIIFTVTIYSPYRESLIISDKDDHTSRIFQMYQRFYDHLPEQIKPKLDSNKRGTIISTSYEATISVETVSDDLARGATLKCAHASEYAMWRKQQEAMASLNSAVALSPDTMLFIETTAKGMNFFRDLFINAYENNNSNLKAWFEPWYKNKDYRNPYYGQELYHSGTYGDEIKLLDEYQDKGMTKESLMWRRAQIDAMGLDLFHQENPTYPEEAFLSTGVSVFNSMMVNKRIQELRNSHQKIIKGNFEYDATWSENGQRIKIDNIRFAENPNGDVSIFEKPIEGYPYVIGADPAGLNGKDYFVAQVIRHDGNNRKQVAVFRKQKLDPDEFGMLLYCLGSYYNNALIGVEINMGQNPNKRLAQAGYRKIYVRQNIQAYDEPTLNQYGISTQGSNKWDMVNTLKERFREHEEEFNDLTTLNEMLTFVVLDIGSRGNYIVGAATQSDHDDTVMALAIAHTIALTNQQTTSVNVAIQKQKDIPFALKNNKQSKGHGLWKSATISY